MSRIMSQGSSQGVGWWGPSLGTGHGDPGALPGCRTAGTFPRVPWGPFPGCRGEGTFLGDKAPCRGVGTFPGDRAPGTVLGGRVLGTLPGDRAQCSGYRFPSGAPCWLCHQLQQGCGTPPSPPQGAHHHPGVTLGEGTTPAPYSSPLCFLVFFAFQWLLKMIELMMCCKISRKRPLLVFKTPLGTLG